jgi:uncharacterized protein (DUF1499 family)
MWKHLMWAAAALVLAACASSAPQLRDMRTGLLAPCAGVRDCVGSQDGGVEPIRYSGPLGEARGKMGRVLLRMKVYQIVRDEGDYILATRSDGHSAETLELVFSQREPGVVHVRSSGGGGLFGLGNNREHVEDLRRAFTIAKS